VNLAGHPVLITGGTSGIGLALAEAFLAAGSQVAVCARSGERLDTVLRSRPGLRGQVCDVSRDGDRMTAVDHPS